MIFGSLSGKGNIMANHTFDQYIRKEMIINVAINVLINCAIIWFVKKDAGPISAGGEAGFQVDILATSFLLFFIMSLVVISIHRVRFRAGKLPEFHHNAKNWRHKLFGRLPYSVWLLALGFALFALLVFAPITLGLLVVFGISEFSPVTYTVFKGVWVAVLVAIMNRTIIEAAIIRILPD